MSYNFSGMVPNCPWCQIVRGAKLSVFGGGAKLSGAKLSWCQIVRGAKLSAVPNCPGAKLSAVPNCPRCQIVRGAKLSGAKLSAVPNCPRCQIVLVPNCPIIFEISAKKWVCHVFDVFTCLRIRDLT